MSDIQVGDTIFYNTINDRVVGMVIKITANRSSGRLMYKVLTRKMYAQYGTTTRLFFGTEIERTNQKNVFQIIKELTTL